MKMNSTNIMFIMIMMNTVIMVMSSNNFLFSWMMMELNLICFIPLISKSKKITDQSMKYLIIQSCSSSILLFSVFNNLIMNFEMNSSIMMMLSMMMKLGLMPTHLWLPSMMVKMSWLNCIVLSTIQKIIPTILTTQLISIKLMMSPMIISLLLSPMVGMKQLSTKKMLAYSSISNMPWMLMSLYNSKQQFMLFMFTYTIMNFMLMMFMDKTNMLFLNQSKPMNKMNKLNLMIMMLSMSGMPPMIGFFIKWMILYSAIMNNMMIVTISMILSSTIITYMYLKMSYNSITMFSLSKKKINFKVTMKFLLMNMFLIFLLMVMP